MKNIWILLLIPLLPGCNSDDDSPKPTKLLYRYDFKYMEYPDRVVQPRSGDQMVYLQYSSKKAIKRTGGLLSISSGTGYNYTFSNEVFDTLVYSGEQVIIERKTSLPDMNVFFKLTITLDEKGRMHKKVKETGNIFHHDTTTYEYNESGMLTRSISVGPYQQRVSDFFYNAQQNLDSIVTRNESLNPGILSAHVVEVFTNYDKADNPAKNLSWFEELFNRSLSRNNYTRYEYKTYHPQTHSLLLKYNKEWTLSYDEDGRVDFSK